MYAKALLELLSYQKNAFVKIIVTVIVSAISNFETREDNLILCEQLHIF